MSGLEFLIPIAIAAGAGLVGGSLFWAGTKVKIKAWGRKVSMKRNGNDVEVEVEGEPPRINKRGSLS